jgi:RND family efflux transporter MFP subunit
MHRNHWTGFALITAAALMVLPGCEPRKPKKPKPGPPEVRYTVPTEDTVRDNEEFIGHLDAIKTNEIRARVTGYLSKVLFEDGTEVREGTQLFEIDPRPYLTEFHRTEAALKQAEAHEQRLSRDFARAQANLQRGALSRAEFDTIASDYAEATAAVGASRAARDMADLNLSFTRVTSPITGRLSRRLVDPGNIVQADSTLLTTVVTLDPMYVYFDVDERTLLKLRDLLRSGRLKPREEGGEYTIRVALADEKDFPRTGKINFTDNKIDAATGTLRVRGSIDNPKPRVLSPGMFARIQLPIGEPHRSLLVPEQAVGTDQGRKFLFVIKPDDVIENRSIEVGALFQGLRVVNQGLKPGERVVVVGQQRIQDGVKVKPKPMETATRKSAAADTVRPAAIVSRGG